jgi:hypothetical protein
MNHKRNQAKEFLCWLATALDACVHRKRKKSIILHFVRLIGILLFMIYYRWALIAGRIPGRKAEEIERYWIMRHCEGFASRRKEQKRDVIPNTS